MRCSSCEVLLDRYVEGTLSPKQMLAIGKHLERCQSCASLVAELRVVDALLATTAPVDLAPNFTFSVMAEVRSMPVAVSRGTSIWALLSFYMVGAWIALTAALLAFGPHVATLAALAANVRGSVLNSLAAFGGAAHAFSPTAPFVAVFVVTVLAVDVVLIAALVAFYRNVRPRLVAQLATSEAS